MAFDLFTLSKERRDGIFERFFEKVRKRGKDNCWEWKGRKNKAGYGSVGIRLNGKQHVYSAHRLSWIIHHDCAIPDGLNCLHSCDNASCINPLHIMLGTRKQNSMDSINKGRAKPWGRPYKPKI